MTRQASIITEVEGRETFAADPGGWVINGAIIGWIRNKHTSKIRGKPISVNTTYTEIINGANLKAVCGQSDAEFIGYYLAISWTYALWPNEGEIC